MPLLKTIISFLVEAHPVLLRLHFYSDSTVGGVDMQTKLFICFYNVFYVLLQRVRPPHITLTTHPGEMGGHSGRGINCRRSYSDATKTWSTDRITLIKIMVHNLPDGQIKKVSAHRQQSSYLYIFFYI